MADRRDRGEFLRTFFRRYEGASVEGIERLVDERVASSCCRGCAGGDPPDPRAPGRRPPHDLITAAAGPFVQPLAPLFDQVVAARLEVRDGLYTGYLAEPPLVGEARGGLGPPVRRARGRRPQASYAYADSHSDLALLRAVGNPVAVSPDAALLRVAKRRRWPIEEWQMSGGMPAGPVPEAGGAR